MRKLYFLLCLMLTSVAGFSQLITEPFDYTPSPATTPTPGLSIQSNAVWRTVNSGDSILVDAGNLTYPGLAASTGNKVKFDGAGTDYYRNLPSNQTSGTVYASFLLNITALGGLNSTGGYFFVLSDGSSNSNHASTVWVRLSGTGYNIGINSRTTAANTTWLSPTLNVNTTYLVVVSYTIVAGTANDYASMWLNPVTLGGTAPAADAVASVAATDLANVGRVQLRQDATSSTPFVSFDELRIGTDFASVTPKDPAYTTPTLGGSPLPSFGSQCINNTYGPNSFNVGGSNLTAADITVGPLAGFTFSTTAAGTYTPTLTLTQPGGTYLQTVYVNFTPTAVQSFNGTIPVSGGGAAATTVAAFGSGINVPVVTTGASSAITTSGATLAGTIVYNGCSVPSSYGIEYSTTNNFTPGTGTQVASTNLSGSAYSSVLSGLAPGVTYYYVAYATNASGTGYGAQASFTTAVPPAPTQAPVATAATAITSSGFTANWNAVSDATNYRLDVFTESNATVANTNIAAWTMSNQYIPKYADTGTVYNVVNIDSIVTTATNAITNASGPSGGIGTTPNPFAVQATGWDAGQDTKYWEINMSTLGATNMMLSSLQGSSSTGPRDFKVQYKIGASGSYADLPGATVQLTTAVQAGQLNTWGAISNVAIPAAAENQPVVYFRWIMTSNTSVNAGTVAPTGTSRLAAIYITGNYTGTVRTYVPGYQNLSVGNVTTYVVTGLAQNTTYNYVVRAENAGGYSQNSNKITVVTATAAVPALTATTLADFGNNCINTSAGPNSFTVTGSNLSGNVTVNALAGYTYSTTSGGTYTSTLTLTPVSGAINQTVYVKFTPIAVQSYNGPITLSGGGATTQLVQASGAGINTAPSVATGAASGVTPSAATLAGTISSNGCSTVTSYGFVYSTTSGFNPATTGITVTSSNLAAGAFSASLSGLTTNTTYYYVAYASNGGGTTYGTQQSFTTGSNPSLSAGTLTAFGNTCINTTAGPNSFTVTGSNLNTDSVTVNPLPGFAYAYTAGGPYMNVLQLYTSGGALNRTVFVQFTPTAVQSYNGNISLTGFGVSTVNVAASGSGVNTAATVTTDAPSAIGSTSATTAGSIPATGCSAVTAYGVVYSTTNGFNPASTGTVVNGSTLVGNSFTAAVSGLAPSTTYYYVAYATNGAGTVYGTQSSFTTAAAPALSAGTLTAFGTTCINTTTAANSFTVTGSNLTGNVTVNALAGYTFSSTSGGTYSNTLTLVPTSGALNATVFVKFTPTAVQSYNGNISVSGGGATAINVAASGSGVNTPPSVPTASNGTIGSTTAAVTGNVATTGCSALTSYGVIYSTTNGFNPATTGTTANGSSISSGSFPVSISGLTPGTIYYYVPFVMNAAGTTVYGTQQTFTTTSVATIPVAPVATAATGITSGSFMANWNAVTGATGYFLDVYTLGAGSGTQTIAGWDMATNTSVTAASTANQGNGNNINIQMLTTNSGGTLSTPSGYSGTSGTPNPYSVSSNGWNTGSGNKYWQVDVNTTGASNLSLSFNQGGSATGPRDWKIQYRVGAAGTWTDVPGGAVTLPAAVAVPGTPATWAVVSNLPIPTDAENKPLVSFRWLMNSDFAINGSTPVASGGTDRLSGIYVKAAGGAATPVYVTGYQNLPVNNVTSFNVTGLTPNTTYYYVVRATNAAGTSANSNEITVTTAIAPVLSASTLTAFGSQCPNTTSTANSFTITGSALQAGNVTVGPLAGYAFSTTSGGTYSSTLTIPTTGGALSQQVFVQFTPTAVQSYSGNIPVSGAGASAINVAATGAGANNAPTVTAGTATAVTNITATVPGTISNNGCTAVSAYGIEYSTTSGFANGSGTQAPASNLAAGSFSSALSGLTASTTYYYHAFATNAGGTAYSTQGTFTTAAGPVISLTASTLATFDSVCVGTVSAPHTFVITGTNLTAGNITVAAANGYQFATTAAGPYSPALALAQTGGSYNQTVFVQFAPSAVQAYNGSIAVSGGGASTILNVLATGVGKVQGPTVVTLDSTNISYGSVSLRGAVLSNGCSALTETGVEWSVIPNFAAGTGTQVAATGIPTGASYLVNLSNLVPGMTYYYRAYARNAGATGYGAVKSVTLPGLLAGLRIWPMPVMAGQSFQLTLSGLTPGYHGIVLYSSNGAQVYRRNLFIQATYINERISFPASLAAGTYLLRVVNNDGTVASQTIVINH